MHDFKALVEDMKNFYNVKSLEAVAEKMGKSKNTALCWRGRKAIPSSVLLQFQKDKDNANITTQAKNKINVRYFPNVTASAGYGAENTELDYKLIPLDESLLCNTRIVNKHNLDIIRVEGDSMLPTFKSGDKAIIERGCDVKNGNTVIANINGEIYIKQIEKDPLGKWVRLISNNENYATIELRGDELELLSIIGVVRGIFREV